MSAHDDRDALVQAVYARWLDAGTKLGFVLLIASFVAYALGTTEPYVALERLPQLWSLSVDRYNAAIHAPVGWGWLLHWWRSDYLTYSGIVVLLTTAMATMLRAATVLYGLGERAQALVAALQVVVLLLAAAGVASAAH